MSKVLGAVYRIPLTAFLGGRGMGIYQMVYPLYCILLTVSASGIPTGVARLISSGKSGAESQAFRLYSVIGLVGTVIMYALSAPLAALQGEPAVRLCCVMLCPSVFFVSVLSVVRGYFQGMGNMYPTAVTEVSEQVVKVALGCFTAYVFRRNLTLAVASTLFAVTASEVFACAAAVIWYRRKRGVRPLYSPAAVPFGDIAAYTVPLTLTAIAQPLSQLAESVITVRLLAAAGESATVLYGVYSGCAVTIINLPASLTYGLAAAGVPKIAPLAERGDIAAAKKSAMNALLYTFLVSLPMAIALLAFAPLAAKLIFGSLGAEEKNLLIFLVRVCAVNAVTISLVQTSSAALTALGKPRVGAATQWISAILRVALTAVLIKFTNLSITGAAISSDCCYLVATLINFWYIIRKGGGYENNVDRLGRRRRRADA